MWDMVRNVEAWSGIGGSNLKFGRGGMVRDGEGWLEIEGPSYKLGGTDRDVGCIQKWCGTERDGARSEMKEFGQR